MKIHLRTISSEDRLISGTDIEAECGVMVPKAIFAFSFDLQYADVASLNRVTTCADCYAISKPTGVMYGLVTGQEAIIEDSALAGAE